MTDYGKINRLKEKFKENGMKVIFVKDRFDALDVAKRYIKDGISVGFGGSVSVKEIGLQEYVLSLKSVKVYNQYEEGISMEENIKRRREGLCSDLYITGTNALSVNGELINVDGSGNRVAAQIFGPKKVLIIAGVNKIVDSVEEGFERIRKISMPKNIERINSISVKNGKEPQYNENNIANKFVYINGDEKGRTTIILIDEELGF